MSYTCVVCGMTSHNPNDEREKYCGKCHTFQAALIIWTIYKNPIDYPGKWVLRGFAVPGGMQDHVKTADTLHEIRAFVPEGLVKMPRHLEDDPAIYETWF